MIINADSKDTVTSYWRLLPRYRHFCVLQSRPPTKWSWVRRYRRERRDKKADWIDVRWQQQPLCYWCHSNSRQDNEPMKQKMNRRKFIDVNQSTEFASGRIIYEDQWKKKGLWKRSARHPLIISATSAFTNSPSYCFEEYIANVMINVYP